MAWLDRMIGPWKLVGRRIFIYFFFWVKHDSLNKTKRKQEVYDISYQDTFHWDHRHTHQSCLKTDYQIKKNQKSGWFLEEPMLDFYLLFIHENLFFNFCNFLEVWVNKGVKRVVRKKVGALYFCGKTQDAWYSQWNCTAVFFKNILLLFYKQLYCFFFLIIIWKMLISMLKFLLLVVLIKRKKKITKNIAKRNYKKLSKNKK